MRTIIAGSRGCTDERILFEALEHVPWDITTVLCGMAKGADALGWNYGASMDGVELEEYPANWKDMSEPCIRRKNQYGEYNMLAGKNRNQEMADNADALIALWDGKSGGTKDMIDRAFQAKLKIFIWSY